VIDREAEMPFFTAEANGRPFVVLQAADEPAAVATLNNPMVVIELSTRSDADGKLIWAGVTPLKVRPATDEEVGKWNGANSNVICFLIDNTTMAPTRPGRTPYT
jgi:hypothetical protein